MRAVLIMKTDADWRSCLPILPTIVCYYVKWGEYGN